jgi:hypothetical protein
MHDVEGTEFNFAEQCGTGMFFWLYPARKTTCDLKSKFHFHCTQVVFGADTPQKHTYATLHIAKLNSVNGQSKCAFGRVSAPNPGVGCG